MSRLLLLAVLAVSLLPGVARAQAPPGGGGGGRALSAQGQQDLTFGDVIPGVMHFVPSTDATAAARIEITGQGGSEVLVDFLLPTELTRADGASLPLVFAPGDAGYAPDGGIDDQTTFDPTTVTTLTLPRNGRGTLYLGGTVDPPVATPPGPYGATLTLTLSYVGN